VDTTGISATSLANLRQNNIQYWFYLPADPPKLATEHYADLSKMTGVARSYFRPINPANLVERLRPAVIRSLQAALASYHGRPFGFNTRDAVPESSDYLCVRCFYDHARVTRQTFTEGTRFTTCRECGNELWEKYLPPAPAE